jgi:Domain of unknown function (DUF4328)
MGPTGQFSADGYWMWNGAQWVPNPYRPAAAPPVAAPYESAGFRAGVASILVGATIPGLVLLTGVELAIDLIPNPNDQQSLFIGLAALLAVVLWLGVLIAAAVFFCMWLHRVIRNMPALGAPDPRWSPARSVVYCFVPIISLWQPLLSVLDAWRGADASQRWLAQASRRRIPTPPLFVVWWGAWLVGIFSGNVGSRATGPTAAVLDVIGAIAVGAAAVLCILVIRGVTARQERKNQLIVAGQLV